MADSRKLVLNEEERMVREAAADFLADQAGPDALRKLRDEDDTLGWSRETWQQMTELGWPAILVPEEFGGLGFGHVAMGQISELGGRSLACSPLFATSIVGATALALAADSALASETLAEVAAGEKTLALAIDETARHKPSRIEATLTAEGDRFRLSGNKQFVVDGASADSLLVVARRATEGDLALLLIDRDSEGLQTLKRPMVDSRNAASLTFDNVSVASKSILATDQQAEAILDNVLTTANAHLAAELQGIAMECFDRTLQYLKDRKQFGVPIGSFQALQHRTAELWTEIELCKSLLFKALRTLEESPADARLLVSMAKAKTCRTAERATNEAIQMHGGIGMTDEFDLGFYLKRARVVQMLFGDHRYHLDRCARLSGY